MGANAIHLLSKFVQWCSVRIGEKYDILKELGTGVFDLVINVSCSRQFVENQANLTSLVVQLRIDFARFSTGQAIFDISVDLWVVFKCCSSAICRRLQALRGRWQRFCALQQRQKALLEEADSSMPASGSQSSCK